MSLGADLLNDGSGASFRVWAPVRKSVEVTFGDDRPSVDLHQDANGYFSGRAPGIRAGSKYKYKLDGDELCPDPASRFQPDGPHGFSEIVDPHRFSWSDRNWTGIRLRGQVIYETHLGTFTQEGTWNSAATKLPYLRDTGITVVEIMPVASFSGKFGWGYDGVQPYAPASIYGRRDDMRSFVNRAH